MKWNLNRQSMMLGLVLAVSVFMSGCASAPTAEITTTKDAVAAAQTEEIRMYAPDSLKAAEDDLNKALADIQAEDGKFALSRDYKAATEMLKAAREKAEKAASDAQVNKAKAKAEAETALASLAPVIEEAKKALATAPRGKDSKADLEAMQNDLKAAEDSGAEITQAMSQEKYLEALAKINAAKSKASGIVEQVKQAREKAGMRRD